MKRSSSIVLSCLLFFSSPGLMAQKKEQKQPVSVQTNQKDAQLKIYALTVYKRASEVIQTTKSRKTATCAKCIKNDDAIKIILKAASKSGFDTKAVYKKAAEIAQEKEDKILQLILHYLSQDKIKTWLKEHPVIGGGVFAVVAAVSGWSGKKLWDWWFKPKNNTSSNNTNSYDQVVQELQEQQSNNSDDVDHNSDEPSRNGGDLSNSENDSDGEENDLDQNNNNNDDVDHNSNDDGQESSDDENDSGEEGDLDPNNNNNDNVDHNDQDSNDNEEGNGNVNQDQGNSTTDDSGQHEQTNQEQQDESKNDGQQSPSNDSTDGTQELDALLDELQNNEQNKSTDQTGQGLDDLDQLIEDVGPGALGDTNSGQKRTVLESSDSSEDVATKVDNLIDPMFEDVSEDGGNTGKENNDDNNNQLQQGTLIDVSSDDESNQENEKTELSFELKVLEQSVNQEDDTGTRAPRRVRSQNLLSDSTSSDDEVFTETEKQEEPDDLQLKARRRVAVLQRQMQSPEEETITNEQTEKTGKQLRPWAKRKQKWDNDSGDTQEDNTIVLPEGVDQETLLSQGTIPIAQAQEEHNRKTLHQREPSDVRQKELSQPPSQKRNTKPPIPHTTRKKIKNKKTNKEKKKK